MTVIDRKRDKQLAILSALRASDRPLTSLTISEELASLGHLMSERTVRLYLKEMDEDGLTDRQGRKGRRITERGLSELDASRIIERVGFLSARIDRMTYRMNFDLVSRQGTVVVNLTIVEPHHLVRCADMFCSVFEEGYAMGQLIALLVPGERVGHLSIPETMVGIGTVCSITLNGVLLKYGIPTNSRFAGLLEIRDRKPLRFVEMITYEGTSIDPLEVFIRSGMTDYVGAIRTGSGRIGASFREFPTESRDLVEDLARRLEGVGLGGFMRIGLPSQSLFEIPVTEGRVGAVVIGGLNPVSILEETGVRAYSRALAGLIDYSRLFKYDELPDRLRSFL
jgi:hypothetical protein